MDATLGFEKNNRHHDDDPCCTPTAVLAGISNGSAKITCPPLVFKSPSTTSGASKSGNNKTESSKNHGNKTKSGEGGVICPATCYSTTNSSPTSPCSWITKELLVLEKEQTQIDAEAALLEKKLRMVMGDTGMHL